LSNKIVLTLLVLILIFGSLLRLCGLNIQSLGYDELTSWRISCYNNLSTLIDQFIKRDVHPPGYQILLYYIEMYVGDSELILRFPSAISGILSILVIFLIGVRLYSYREGLIAAACMAVLWAPVYYSQDARSYSLLLLFTMSVTYFGISIARSLHSKVRPSFYTICGYIITSIVSSYLHYFGLYLVLLYAIGALLFFIRKKHALIYIFIIYFLILLAYVPWLPALWHHLNRGPTWIKAPVNFFGTFFKYLCFLFNRSKGQSRFVLMMCVFLFLRSLFRTLRLKSHNIIKALFLSPGFFLILWLVIPFVGVYIQSILLVPVLSPRNLIISLPAAYLLLARSITQLPTRSRNQAVIALMIACFFLYSLIFHLDYYSRPLKEQYREAVSVIVENEKLYKDSLIIGFCHNSSWGMHSFNYYFQKKGSNTRVYTRAGEEKDIAIIDKVIDVKKPHYVWYVHASRVPEAKFLDFLDKRLSLVLCKRFFRAEVRLYENRYGISR